MAEKIKGLLIDIKAKEVRTVEFEDTLENICGLIGADLIDVAERKVDSKFHDFIVDDEGLLKSDPIASVYSSSGKSVLFGSVLIVNHDGEGGFASLTDEEINSLRGHCMPAPHIEDGAMAFSPALFGVDYE